MSTKVGILSKKGDWYKITYHKSKFKTAVYDLPDSFVEPPADWLGQEIEFEMPSGSILSVTYKGDKISIARRARTFNVQQALRNNQNENDEVEIITKKPRQTDRFARAPYNFVPLNSGHPALNSEYDPFDVYNIHRKTGYIEIEIKNLTPIFIRQISDNVSSYGYDKKFGISGSSMRGMTRTICEIISFGKFGSFDNKVMFYRNSRRDNEDILSGYIKLENGIFKIYNCECDSPNRRPTSTDPIVPTASDLIPDELTFTSGKYGGRCNIFIFSNPNKAASFSVAKTDEVYTYYMSDESRDSSAPNVFEEAAKGYFPIFFQVDKNTDSVSTIGSAKYHRVPYTKSISDHVPENLKKSDDIESADLVQGLFGDTFDDGNMIASRLSFGDLMAENCETYSNEKLLKILSSPKPTTYQHYLEQNDNQNTLMWGSDANIRGFKLYWHRKTNDKGLVDVSWNEERDDNSNANVQSAPVKPIKAGAIFKGKIWFQNLTDVELGCVLSALEPPNDTTENEKIAHKIGLGKPLGLGSIKISIAGIETINTAAGGYYTSLSDHADSYSQENKDELKRAFDKECRMKMNLHSRSIWNEDRLIQLKTMLLWKSNEVGSTEHLQKTRYMEIKRNGVNEFKYRPILPKPTDVDSSLDREFI